jgi:Caspase domain
MKLGRRTFLNQAGLTLASLGLSEAGLFWLGDRYQQALAQPTRRKLALLVGINQYSGADFLPLAGCLTDVELQRELLIHRFGFQTSDIQVLVDQAATRSNIEMAFTAHLSEQARPGDLVMFHFSGYGQRVQLPNANGFTPQSALIPFDGWVADPNQINDLLVDTLLLLLRSLPTDQVTTVLDAGFTDLGVSRLGNLRVRSRPADPTPIATAELEVRSQLLGRTQLSADQVRVQWLSGQVPGVLMSATQPDQIAVESQWQGFSAGAFTYALTQHLWQTAPPITVWISLNRTISHVQRQVGSQQHPSLAGQISPQNSLPSYDLTVCPAADGVVLSVDAPAQIGKLTLAGLPAQVYAQYGAGSVLALLPLAAGDVASRFEQLPRLQLQTMTGLTAKGMLLTAGQIQPGQLVQESIRVMPRQLSLAIALDPDLERIERVDAVSGFAGLSVPTTISEQAADYLFAQSKQGTGSYGLFSLAGNPLPNTLGQAGEAAKQAIQRLRPKLSLLLGQKLLALTVNDGSSRLGVRAALEVMPAKGTLKVWRRLTTLRAPYPLPAAAPLEIPQADLGRLTLPIGSQIRYRVQNYSDRPIYPLLLSFSLSGDPFFLYGPAQSDRNPGHLFPIEPGTTVTLPHGGIVSDWIVRQTSESVTTYLVFSDRPFSQTVKALVAGMTGSQLPETEQIVPLTNALDVAQALLLDLHIAKTQSLTLPKDVFAFDVGSWATFSFSYQVE